LDELHPETRVKEFEAEKRDSLWRDDFFSVFLRFFQLLACRSSLVMWNPAYGKRGAKIGTIEEAF
jgi:hypothetical protein